MALPSHEAPMNKVLTPNDKLKMRLKTSVAFLTVLLALANAPAQDTPGQDAPPADGQAPAAGQAESFWKIKQSDAIDLTPYKFYLPESQSVELRDWKDKAVLIIYVRAFDKSCQEFLQVFEEKAWPELKNKNIVCYVVGHGDQLPSLVSWYTNNHFTFPIANDPGHLLHNSLCTMLTAFPHIILLDKDHRFCAGIVGGMDPGSEEFMKMVDQVIDVGCPSQN